MRMLLDRRNFCRVVVGSLAMMRFAPRLRAKDESAAPQTVPIHRKAVKSSLIAAIGFDVGLQVLEVEFHTGALYRYFSVPDEVFAGFQKAESKGRYFSQRIRGHYQFLRLHGPKQ